MPDTLNNLNNLTLRTVVTGADLLSLCEHLLVRENGEPWAGDAAKLRSTQLQKLRTYLQTEELEPTFEHVLCAASIQQYCGDAETAASDGSIASMADTAIRLLRFLDPDDEEMGRLEELKTQAEHRARERSATRNAECPIYSVFTGAQTVPAWTEAMAAEATLTTVSQCTWMLLQIAVCPSRERMLQRLRYCDTATFDPKVSHAARTDGEPPATLVCENHVPKKLVLGLHPSMGQRSKNGFYATVELDTPILPEAAHLLPLVRGGLTQLCQGLEDGARVFRREEGNRYGTTFGRNQLGSLFTKTFEHSCGVLRKAVEQRAEELFRSGDLSLDQCAEVHRRCQHKGDTALQKYVLRLQKMETDAPDDVSDAETLDLPPDAIDTSASDDEEPPPLARTGPTTAVGGVPIDPQRGNNSPPQTQDGATQTETQDIADTIESLLHDGSEQSLVTACVALYKYKRSNRDDDTEWLEEAVRTAKKQRGC